MATKKIKARQVREALALMAADFEKPWPEKDGLQKYAAFLKQAAEAIEYAANLKEVDDETPLKYEKIGGNPTGGNPTTWLDRPKPRDCDEDIKMYID